MINYKRLYQRGTVGVLVLLMPLMAGAATFRGGDEEDVIIEAPILDDLYAAGNRVLIKEDVAQDAMVVGQAVAISSVIGEDVFAAGQFVRLEGTVEDDAHMVGNVVEVEGRVEGDLFAAGQTITIAESAVITGDLFAAGQTITIAGTVQGTVRATSEHLILKAGSAVTGDLLTYGQEPHVEEGVVIEGEVRHTQQKQPESTPASIVLLNWVRGVLGLFLLAMLLVWAMPGFLKQTLAFARKKPAMMMLTGFAWLVLALPLTGLLFFSLIGILLAVLVMCMTAIVIIVGSGVSALLIGQWLLKRLDKKSDTDQLVWPQALLGAAIYKTIQILGPAGWVVCLVMLVWGIGALVQTAASKRKH